MNQEETRSTDAGLHQNKLDARRRLVKGAFSVPAALTVASTGSSAVSLSCVAQAVGRDTGRRRPRPCRSTR